MSRLGNEAAAAVELPRAGEMSRFGAGCECKSGARAVMSNQPARACSLAERGSGRGGVCIPPAGSGGALAQGARRRYRRRYPRRIRSPTRGSDSAAVVGHPRERRTDLGGATFSSWGQRRRVRWGRARGAEAHHRALSATVLRQTAHAHPCKRLLALRLRLHLLSVPACAAVLEAVRIVQVSRGRRPAVPPRPAVPWWRRRPRCRSRSEKDPRFAIIPSRFDRPAHE